MRQCRLGQEVVGVAVREARERVRRERCHDEDVRRREVRIRVGGPLLRASAQKVSAATKRSAPAVVMGVTSCPARTSSRTSSHALYAAIPPVTPTKMRATRTLCPAAPGSPERAGAVP